MDSAENTLNVLSLCAGVRGLERGIERSLEGGGCKLNTVAYAEIEAFAVVNLIAGMEAGVLDSAPIWTDLKTFPYEQFHGKIHGIIGGYPCQPFSNAGKRAGENDPRHLWPYIAEGIRAARPLWCFFENVAGHLTLGYETVRGELQEMGYRVAEGIFTAEEVGAPHRRERLFILAVLENSDYRRGWGTQGARKYDNGRGKGKEQDNNTIKAGEGLQYVALSGKTELANRHNKGLEGLRKCNPKERWEKQDGYIRSGCDLWPSRPGEQQYEWEEPRTVKSGMGVSINGYNFREDLLRALGNGVVEQTAELAWNVLWEKINNNE